MMVLLVQHHRWCS